MGKCADCHTLTKKEAGRLLKAESFKARITGIRSGPVNGLWEVEFKRGDETGIVYIDFAKKNLIEGRIKVTPLEKLGEPPELKKVDLSMIPLKRALVFGDPGAAKRVIVFDDPECPYCRKLHEEIKKILGKRKDIVFYVKLYPLPIHPAAYDQSRAIDCAQSTQMLEDAFADKKLPKPGCKSAEVDDNLKLGRRLGISGTPAVILPDGRLIPGYVPADVLLGLIDGAKG